ncbi:MAG: tetratricopeptide (TPR) repeat protein [Pseudohongiellaceae bacterium]|jgi:tetratricopeptide (TPR) repeat protein
MDVEKFITKAEQALAKRAAPAAIALYKQVLVASPDHGRARAGLLAACARKAELKGGPGMLEKGAAKSLAVSATGLARAGQHALVVKSCEAGLEKNPENLPLLGLLGDALTALGRNQEALACWEHRLKLDEADMEALKAAGWLHSELGQVPVAIDYLERAHAIDGHDPEVEKLRKRLLAEGTLASTKFETASSTRELMKDVEAVRRAESAGRRHRTADELAEDVDGLAERLEEHPDDLDLRRRLARAQLKVGDCSGAQATVTEGLKLLPRDDSLTNLAGEVALAMNAEAFDRAKQARDEVAQKRLRSERAELEITEFSRRVVEQPGDVAAQVRLARACYRAGHTERAIESFQAVVADPRAALEAHEGLGACFFRKGMMPLAQRQFDAALKLAGGVGGDRGKEICYHLGLVCERLKQTQDALARYMEIYEIDIHFKDVALKIEALSA